MAFFRSDRMSLCRMLLHTESAFNCLIELGYLGCVQFRHLFDEDSVPNNQFLKQIQRCNEMQRIISHLQLKIDDLGIKTVFYPDVDEDEVPQVGDLHQIETVLEQTYGEFSDVEHNCASLHRQRNSTNEHLQVLIRADRFLTGDRNTEAVMAWSDSVVMHLMQDRSRQTAQDGQSEASLGFFSGTVPVERFHGFEVMLWRVTRGMFYLKHVEVLLPNDDAAHSNLRKYVFMVFFVGDSMRDKIAKLCQGFGARLFQCPESSAARQAEIARLQQELVDLDLVLDQADRHCFRVLLIASADLFIWKVKVKKILKVFHTLNQLKFVRRRETDKYLQAECWIPTRDVEDVRLVLLRGAKRAAGGNMGNMFRPMVTTIPYSSDYGDDRPTFFRLNRFTRGFQNLVDAYGVAIYRELNPAPYTIITFPFLFAVMFGDVGHGLIMTLFGLWMVRRERQLAEKARLDANPSEIWTILFGGRYIITLMGAFSIYTGLIYNDVFSKSLNIFSSRWTVEFNRSHVERSEELQLNPATHHHYGGTPYPFGLDPVWDVSGENAITTHNSIKMKLAIILGVCQMLFGYLLSAANHLHAKNMVDLFLVFVPQITFLTCLFGYLVVLILYKWIAFGGHKVKPYNSACAPSILITFIDMLLMKKSAAAPPGCEPEMYPDQDFVQTVLLIAALLCVPLLLAGKPVFFMLQQRRIEKMRNAERRRTMHHVTRSNMRKSLIYHVEESQHTLRTAKQRSVHERQIEEIDVAELWIHQGIHCIESVLGSVSHTASYLRLWALSLAHDQLSTVLWNMVLAPGLRGRHGYLNGLLLYGVFWFWAILTLAILVVMEGLSAFLHTLRLHWVEFQSKFFAGSGQAFMPFQFEPSTPNG